MRRRTSTAIGKMQHLMGLFCGGLVLFTSCIREELQPCPPLLVEVSVKDKNYFNVEYAEGLETPKAEDLPFQEYIPSLCYALRDAETGECVYEQNNFSVESDDPVCHLTFPEDLPHGTYILTIWGGLTDTEALSMDRTELQLHPDELEGEDVYLTSDVLEYTPYENEFQVDMERTKGKLVVDVEQLDAPVHLVSEHFTGYQKWTNERFEYQGNTTVEKQQEVEPSEQMVVKTYIAPSVNSEKPLLQLHFFDSDGTDLERYCQKDLEVPIYRNKLTALKLIYDTNGDCTILIMIDDSWTNIHDMIVD